MKTFLDVLDLNVSRETSENLELYLQLLGKWNKQINLVSPTTIADARSRHFLDSAQVLALIPPRTQRLADLGSGGGFPGLVVAILAKDLMPNLTVMLVESDQRKASFLRAVLRETSTPGDVLSERIESLDPMQADVVTARALAPLAQLCNFAQRHLAANGIALFLKGKTWGKEIEGAQQQWKFRYTAHTSVTDPDAVVLDLRELSQ